MNIYFKVGEEVICTREGFKGEHVIAGFSTQNPYIDPIGNSQVKLDNWDYGGKIVYWLEGVTVKGSHTGKEIYKAFAQNHLKKKYKKGDDFESLVRGLNLDRKVSA